MKLTEKDRKEIFGFLKKHKLMSLGTYNKQPWSAWVYFLFDDDLNFYFVSNPKTQHCVNISENPKISLAVADSNQDSRENKIGFQASGIAKVVNSASELRKIILAWNKRGFVPITYKVFKKVWRSRFYKIKLNRIQIFDENQPEEFEKRTWEL